MNTFDALGLEAPILRAVKESGYTVPTPIQQKAIPPVMHGKDVLAAAQTGTGKTAGFTLPLLHRLSAHQHQHGSRHPRALILTPTRELAAQVEASVTTYGKYLPFKSALIYGGVGMFPQVKRLRSGVEIIVATPGRLLDHLNQKNVDLSRIETLILDEADRMLDMGFIRDIRKIIAALPAKRQNLLFSATFNPEIKKLAATILHHPEVVETAVQNTASERVAQAMIAVEHEKKKGLLNHMIQSNGWKQVLVFARTKRGADRLAKQLGTGGVQSAAIHGDKSQGARNKALADFKNGKVRVLVATDVAARGIDIHQLPHVVNFDLPMVAEDYVHRIGRTGRAGHEGKAYSLVTPEEGGQLWEIEKLIGKPIPRETVEGFPFQGKLVVAPQNKGQKKRGGQGNGGGPKPAGNRPPRQGARTASGQGRPQRRRGKTTEG